MGSNTTYLPLFPLNVFLLPGEQIPLHIFEERYQQLLNDLETLDLDFGLPYTLSNGTALYGCQVKMIDVSKRYSSGEADILVECTGIFKMVDYNEKDPIKLYPSGDVQLLEQYASYPAQENVREELRIFHDVLGPSASVFDKPEFEDTLRILRALNLSHEQKHKFISLNNPEAQQRSLVNMIRFSRLIVEQEQKVEDGIYPN
jgi:Lon protease-like protein